MAAISVTKAKVGVVFPDRAVIFDFIAGEAITKGQAVAVNTSGKAVVADANGAGLQQFRGIALNDASAGRAVSVLKEGHIAGYDVSALNGDVAVFLSDTAGSLDTAAGTMTVNCGRVVCLTDKAMTKVIYINADWLRAWA